MPIIAVVKNVVDIGIKIRMNDMENTNVGQMMICIGFIIFFVDLTVFALTNTGFALTMVFMMTGFVFIMFYPFADIIKFPWEKKDQTIG
jgi:predicted cobalt transporter CbtA